MGLMENGTPEHESNMMEQSKTSKDFAQDQRYEPPTRENNQMDYERFVCETVEQKEVTEAQNIEKKKLNLIQESSERISEVGPNQEEVSKSGTSGDQELLLENVKIFSVAGNFEGAFRNGLTSLEHLGIPPGVVPVDPGDGKLVPVQLDVSNNFVHSENEDRGTSGQSGKRKSKLKGPVISSWTLRSKSQEKPKASEPIDAIKEGGANGEKKRRGRKRKQIQKNTVNEFSRTRTHLRYLLHRINYEQNLIDAYSAEGWRGQSLDKLKPEKELQQAKSHILRYKLKIRALFQQLDQSLAVGKLPASLFDSQGEIDSEDIFCAKCGSKDLTLDNDIILCDGACERGFHQFCLDPPLLKKDIPPGDESWLCPGCDCKADCIDMLKDFQGTKISIIDCWEKIFPEAAAAASGKKLHDGSGSSSDDSEDEEYDPDKPDADEKVEGDESSSDESSYFSASGDLAAPPNNEKYLGLPSDDSEDDEFDPTAPDQDEQVKQDSSSSDFTSDSEDLEALLEDETEPGKDLGQNLPPADHKQPSTGSNQENPRVDGVRRQSLKDELSYLMETSVEPVSGKRHVERLDYRKLHDETYGNSYSGSSDEDFDDTTARKRMKSNREKTEVTPSNKTLIVGGDMHKEDENQKESEQFPVQTCHSGADGATNESSAKVGSASTSARRSTHKRLGEATTQRLYASFNENQYPERAAKENLAKELGLTVRQVSKWFENARWSYNHRPRVESNTTERPLEPRPTIGADSTYSNQDVELQESSAMAAQNHIALARDENLVANTSGEYSGTRKTRKRKGVLDQAPDDITVGSKFQEQNAINDTQPPQFHSSQSQT